MSLQPQSGTAAIPSSIDQGVDRKTLKTIKQRFFEVNHARLARTRSALGARQQIFLEQLPMLFHTNHPMLPGYVSHQTPSGVSGYNPSKQDIQKAQRLARSFTYRRQPTMQRQIHGIFLMGSCGTVAQSEKSDLDIWICHPSLSTEEQLLLRQKCDDISRWAMSIDLEAHFFLMEDEKFRQGEREGLSSEDCGSSQHYLLLDEFYRTSVMIAGRIPIWWLIPPEEEKNYDYYAEALRKRRFIRKDESLDFGGVGHIPAGEFVGAGVWQLYKAIDSPYKSVLKILLTEVYAAEYPEVEPLSTQFKKSIYQQLHRGNNLDIDELDPYVVVYRKLEKYLLQRNELERLELIRRCFYFKIGKALSRPSRNNSKSWQRLLMEKLVREWGWKKEQLYNLDAHKQWKVGRVEEEQKQLVRELTNSYRFVLKLARRSQASAKINSQEMAILGRKLYAAFERKAGKIEWVNPGIADNLVEDTLTFYQTRVGDNSDKLCWAISSEYLSGRDIDKDKPIKRADELITLLSWCHLNTLLDSSTRISIIEGKHGVSEFELHSMIRNLRDTLPIAKLFNENTEEKHQRFSHAMRPVHIHLLINVGVDPLEHIRTQGIERISDQTDSLGYSGLKENLVLNLEQVTVNSWGELTTRRYDGKHALLNCLKDYLLLLPPGNHGALPRLTIQCYCPTRANAIKLRVEELFRDVAACYYTGTRSPHTRYVLEIQRQFYCLQFDNKQPVIDTVGNEDNLLVYLGRAQSHYSPIVLDRYCLSQSPLAVIVQRAQPDIIQVFYLPKDDTADVFVIDEMGSLYFFNTAFRDEKTLLSPLDQFIQSMLFRRSSESEGFGIKSGLGASLDNDFDIDSFDLSQFELEYYQLHQTGNQFRATRRNIIGEMTGSNFFNVQAIADLDANGRLLFNIYCDQQAFTELELGKDLFNTVARFILSKRQSQERYPCYITDLDLSRHEDNNQKKIQTVTYLQHKQRLEKALNHALQTV